MDCTVAEPLTRAQALWQETLAFQGTQQLHPDSSIAAGESGADAELVQRVLARTRARVAPEESAGAAGADYILRGLLGMGGMGRVYAATQVSLERTVAVKVMRDELISDCKAQELFLAEALLAAELEHPNTAPVYDIGRTENGAPFYAMKLIVGDRWSSELANNSLEDNLRILLMVCDAVAFAHDRGVIHRDLKPENVMIGAYGEVLLVDWGLAASVGNPRARALNDLNLLSGTPAYMPPEVAGCALEKVGRASDLYLLGGILYEIITQLKPHAGAEVLTCINAAMRNDLQPTDKSGELLDVALRALRTEPADRYPSVREFQAALRDYLAHAESLAVAREGWRRFELLSRLDREDIYREANEIIALFKQALVSWSDNQPAAEGLLHLRQTLVTIALRRGEIQLARSHGRALEEERQQFTLPLATVDRIAEQVKASVTEQDRHLLRKHLGSR